MLLFLLGLKMFPEIKYFFSVHASIKCNMKLPLATKGAFTLALLLRTRVCVM